MNTSEINGQMKSTNDYDQFIFMGDNRDIVPGHVNTLIASLKNHNDLHLNPVIVTPDMHVVEGQHRVMAAKELGLTIYYTIDENYSPDKLILFNTTQRKWSYDDYLKYWCYHGREDYIKLKNFQKDIGFPVALTLRWISKDGSNMLISFKSGKFKFKISSEVLQAVFLAIELIKYLKESNYKPLCIFTQNSFHSALKSIFTNPLIDQDRFFKQLEICPYKLIYCGAWQDYFDQFVEIYNYGKLKTNKLRVISEGSKREVIA